MNDAEIDRIIRQARTKIRLQHASELRAFLSGKLDFLPGMLDQRRLREAIIMAYRAGQRSAASEEAPK